MFLKKQINTCNPVVTTLENHRFFNLAKNMAAMSDHQYTHIGCVAVIGNRPISCGFNKNKTHTVQSYYNQYRGFSDISQLTQTGTHAEIDCLNKIWYQNVNWSKIKLYIFRIKNDGSIGIARPCPACMAAIKDKNIKDIYYTTDNGYVHEKLLS